MLAHDLAESSGTTVHPSTVRRSLGRSGLVGRVAAKKPLLHKGNKQKRLQYAKSHKTWDEVQWQNVLWSDESKFEMFGSNRRHYVRRRVGEKYMYIDACLQPTVLLSMVVALSWSGVAFRPMVWVIWSELMES